MLGSVSVTKISGYHRNTVSYGNLTRIEDQTMNLVTDGINYTYVYSLLNVREETLIIQLLRKR